MKSLSPNNFGKTFLVDGCRKIRISDFLKRFREHFKELALGAEMEALGVKIEFVTSKTHFNGTRFWFKCASCQSRVGVLYKHPLNAIIGCRKCLGLEYRKRRFKGMVEEGV